MTSEKGKHEPIVFVQEAIDYRITGSRRWENLTGQEQDEYILACFMGEAARLGLERKLDLLDRTASSVADGLLGPFRQYDINTGEAHYQPETPDRALRVLLMRMAVLHDTPLGERLSRARSRHARTEGRADQYLSDPKLRFYNVGPRGMAGLEILDDKDYGGLAPVNPYEGEWNDWAALEVQQGKELEALKNERWEREMALPPPPSIEPTPFPAAAEIVTDSTAPAPRSWRQRWRPRGRAGLLASLVLMGVVGALFSPDSVLAIPVGILFWASTIAFVVSLIGERPRYALGEIIFLVGIVVWLGASLLLTVAGLTWWFNATPRVIGIVLFPLAAPPAVFLYPFYKLFADGNMRPLMTVAVALLAAFVIIPIGRRLRHPPGASLFP